MTSKNVEEEAGLSVGNGGGVSSQFKVPRGASQTSIVSVQFQPFVLLVLQWPFQLR